MSHMHISTARSVAVCLVVLATLGVAYPLARGSLGDACQSRTIFCADGDGVSPRYLKCEDGSLAMSYCPGTSICVGSKETTIFCAADYEPAKSPIRSSHRATTTTTTLTVEFDSTSTLGVTRGDFYFAASTPASSHTNVPIHAPLPSTRNAALAVLDSPRVLSPPLNQFVSQFPASSTGRAAHLQPAHSHDSVPVNQPPPPQSSESIMPMHPQPTEIPELSQQPLLQSSLQRQHSMTRSADPETADVSFTPSKVSVTIFSSPVMAIARPASDITWITKTTWVLKALPSQTSSFSSSAPIVAPSSRVSKLGGIEAPRVLSVIASAFLAHRLEDSASDSDEEAPFMLSINSASDDAASTSTSVSRSVVRRSISQNLAGPLGARNEKCNPGARSCEVSGQSPVFFICDGSGTSVPASCVTNTVCYQYDDAILCSAPKSNIAVEHKRIAMF